MAGIALQIGVWTAALTVAHVGVTAQAPTSSATRRLVTCPDTAFYRACQSYEELLKAKDEGAGPMAVSAGGGIALVCFRQSQDEFFLLDVGRPAWSKTHVEARTGKTVPDDLTTARAAGYVRTFINGIQRESPLGGIISGAWNSNVLLMFEFKAEIVGGREVDGNSGFTVDEGQISGSRRYKNIEGREIDYRLAIQRSTGRFSETYAPVVGQSATSLGRCISQPGKSRP